MTAVEALGVDIGTVRHSPWLVVDQPMIDRFADATLDRQFIHLDPVGAAATPFGGTVAHGMLTLSLLPHLLETIDPSAMPPVKITVNYGFDRVRFVHPVRTGSRIRGAFTLSACEEKRPGRFQQTINVAVEIDGTDKPALTAVWLSQFLV